MHFLKRFLSLGPVGEIVMELEDLVLIIDISPSMGKSYQDMKPSKLYSVKEALAYFAPKIIEQRKVRMGIVAFYGIAFPMLDLSDDRKKIIRTISLLDVGGPGSAPGDGLIEATKMLRSSVREKRALLLTDGGFNEGIKLDYAALYASNSGVKVDIIVIGEPEKGDKETIDLATKLTRGNVYEVKNKSDLFSILTKLI